MGCDRKASPVTSITRRHFLSVRHIDRFIRERVSGFAWGGLVVDYGYGNKPYGSLFGAACLTLIGVDVEQSSNSQADVLVAREGSLPFREDAFNGAICSQVLEHVSDPRAVRGELRRVLKPDGLLLRAARLLQGPPRVCFSG